MQGFTFNNPKLQSIFKQHLQGQCCFKSSVFFFSPQVLQMGNRFFLYILVLLRLLLFFLNQKCTFYSLKDKPLRTNWGTLSPQSVDLYHLQNEGKNNHVLMRLTADALLTTLMMGDSSSLSASENSPRLPSILQWTPCSCTLVQGCTRYTPTQAYMQISLHIVGSVQLVWSGNNVVILKYWGLCDTAAQTPN